MKKSLLALTLACVGTSAIATTVYDKDGTTFTVDARIHLVYYSGNNDGIMGQTAGDHDASLQNSTRFGFGGTTDVGFAKLIGYTQWDMADSKKFGENIYARDQFVGVDFKQYGSITAGRYRPAMLYVTAPTYIYEDYTCSAQFYNDERNTGHIDYAFSKDGFDFKLGYVTAVDAYTMEHSYRADGKYDIEGGLGGAVGYTTDDDVLFGPISVRAGYEYIKGQDDYSNALKDANTFAFGASWGNLNSGFYTAAMYNQRDYSYNKGHGNKFRSAVNPDDLTVKGFEYAIAYSLDCGVSFRTGFANLEYKTNGVKAEIKNIPAYVNYQVTPNFNVWVEGRFDVSNTEQIKLARTYFKTSYLSDKACGTIGANYNF